MPRAKKTMGGAPGQKVEAFVGQTYGDAKRQEQLQQSMPAPSQPTTQSAGQPPQSAEAAQPTESPSPRPRMSLADAISSVAGMGGLLSAPDDNPNIPVTDGLVTGPGRGPEALRTGSTLQNTLRSLAMQTGDPVFNELLMRARF